MKIISLDQNVISALVKKKDSDLFWGEVAELLMTGVRGGKLLCPIPKETIVETIFCLREIRIKVRDLQQQLSDGFSFKSFETIEAEETLALVRPLNRQLPYERIRWHSVEDDVLAESKKRDLDSRKQRVSDLEANLTERVELVSQTVRERNLTLIDIARSLPADAALVDLFWYRRYNFASKTNQWKEHRYVAYVTFPLPKDSTNEVAERVDLGEAQPIDAAIEEICRLMAVGQIAPRRLNPALRRLSELVWTPLSKHLTNTQHLIVCPDGQLSRVPFEMLLVSPAPDGKYLIEEKTISYVSSGREVARIAHQANSKSDVQSSTSVVMGDPDFDLDVAQASQPAGSAGIPARSSRGAKQVASQLAGETPALLSSAVTDRRYNDRLLSHSYRGFKFKRLPGAADEARAIARLLGDNCTLRLGAQARERDLKDVQSPRVLHLATHAFFLSDQEFKQTNAPMDLLAARAFGAGTTFGIQRRSWARDSASPPQNDWENPMLRCGIALAGANHARQIINAVAEDGLLTGLEASQLNLQGTELVILSACDSGTGEWR